MSTEGRPPPSTVDERLRTDWSLPQSGSKRKFCWLVPPLGQGQRDYPSPPMSTPPSPPSSSASELARGLVSEPLAHVSTDAARANLTAPDVPVPLQSFQATALPPPPLPPPHSRPLSDPSSVGSPSLAGPGLSQHQVFAPLPTRRPVASGSSAFAVSPIVAEQPSNRSGRKPKAHVASACVNCKRAHLSCDIQRPCARCVASGKQDSCYDVQHKKRGRPRLREEGDFKIEQMVPEQASEMTVPTASSQGARPIAAPRQRRADSLRSLRSQTSEGSSLLTPTLPPPPALQLPFKYPQPPPSAVLTPAEVPTAFLDVDLVFLRANQPYQQIMSDGRDIKGLQLSDVATPTDNESFHDIRNRLRAEREAREPSYMPPITQSALDPIQGVSEVDVERLTYGFTDHTYTWSRSRGGPNAETFPARVRLGKSTSYFVVVTLPSFRPAPISGPPPIQTNPFATPHLSPMAIQSAPAPGAVYPPLAPSVFTQPRRASLGTQSYPSPQYATTHKQPIVPSTPQHFLDRPPAEAAFPAPQPVAREATQPSAQAAQQATIGERSMMSVGASASGRVAVQPQQGSLEEGDEEESTPKKRRRVGIEEVLQR